ncbi:Glutathione S-transferase family protein [Minicystis rosea]|nr:Glutathione S-transferase family protein [Minicystis rosea]
MTELLGISFSPWTEKARWALDARRVPYRFRHYQPLLGEPALRLKLRQLAGRVSVPVLTTDEGRAIADSAEIARWADGRGEGPALFPAGHEAAMARFIALSERALAAGRTLSLTRMLQDDEALAEMVPGPIRRALGPFAAKMGAFGVARTQRKYGGSRRDLDAARRELLADLDELRAALAEAPSGDGPKTLLGHFSFADIAMAQTLAFGDPPASGLKLGPASRRSFSDPELRDRYGDLLAWRDELYRTYRKA